MARREASMLGIQRNRDLTFDSRCTASGTFTPLQTPAVVVMLIGYCEVLEAMAMLSRGVVKKDGDFQVQSDCLPNLTNPGGTSLVAHHVAPLLLLRAKTLFALLVFELLV
jgi:hypothetical protein